ncbi:hypothetical protein [Streptomyces sp900116325]|uniref:hypothetical protein n=1 Tax=Streptomyces sp. 900116325 TaxID=3154295 RepID=UPI00340CBA67
MAAIATAVALLVAGAVAGLLLPLGAGAAAVLLVWMATALRVLRLDAACPRPGGGRGQGGAGVREPRRPGPLPPVDAIRLPLPDDRDGGAVARA